LTVAPNDSDADSSCEAVTAALRRSNPDDKNGCDPSRLAVVWIISEDRKVVEGRKSAVLHPAAAQRKVEKWQITSDRFAISKLLLSVATQFPLGNPPSK
jgi:hypothetical protein